MIDFKSKALNFIQLKGPVLPVQLSKEIGKDTLTAGAILSELVSKKQIKISKAKVGGSPLYYLPGQENKLEQLYKYLPEKEKEAYDLLRKEIILEDVKQEPAIRVALREIKDFAVPLKIKDKMFWKWNLTSNDQAEIVLRNKLEIEEPKKKTVIEKIKEKVIKKVKKKTESKFSDLVDNYINSMEILERIENKSKKEEEFIVRVNSDLGELEFYLYARDKKRINDGDLSLAYNKGQQKKLPVILLCPGNLTKKAEKYLNDNLRGFLVFKKLK